MQRTIGSPLHVVGPSGPDVATATAPPASTGPSQGSVTDCYQDTLSTSCPLWTPSQNAERAAKTSPGHPPTSPA